MTQIIIRGSRALIGDELVDASIEIEDGTISRLARDGSGGSLHIDGRGLLALPGVVDLHGDAFERQMMPRPGVDFPTDVALLDSDRQAVANGMTTVFHATTWSWEPGLRGEANAHRLIDAIETLHPRLAADTRFHLRQETFNLDAESSIVEWLAAGRIDLLAFNDHMTAIVVDMTKPHKRARMAERAGIAADDFDVLVERVSARAPEVSASIARLAAAARTSNTPMLSHDDESPDQRQWYRAQGVRIAEFPVNVATARNAIDAGEFTVFGAPNVVRGGSHTGWTNAADMVRQGLCSILASDYYYPAPVLAAFRLAHDHVLPLPLAWRLVSAAPALAAGLHDRGQLAQGLRADVVLVDAAEPLRPRVVAVIANGKLAHLTDAGRIWQPNAVSRTMPPNQPMSKLTEENAVA